MIRRSRRTARRASLQLAGWVCVLLGALLVGEPLFPQAPRLGESSERQVVFETRYRFFVRSYLEPVRFPATHPPAIEGRPVLGEELAVQLLVYRVRGEVDGWLRHAAPEYVTAFRRDLEQRGLTMEQLGEQWRERYEGVILELTHHGYRGLIEIIRYRAVEEEGEVVEVDDLAFGRSEEGPWQLIDLSGDPMAENWIFEGDRKVLRRKLEQEKGSGS